MRLTSYIQGNIAAIKAWSLTGRQIECNNTNNSNVIVQFIECT